MAHVKKFCFALLLLLVLLLATGSSTAQDEPELRITRIDLSEFPTVGVRLLTRDATGSPIGDLSNLVLRENRAPIPEHELTRVPTGIDLILVLDANDTFLQSDENDGVTRREHVAASVEQFARQFMDPTGLDRVTVIVPGENGGAAVLAENISSPPDLAQIVADYQPTTLPRVTPLNDMITAGLDHLADQQSDGRFQTLLLFTDGARLDTQLAYQDLVSTTQTGGVSLFGAILGATADENEAASIERLTSLTRGQWIHMPDATAAEPLYRQFQSQGQQTEARYQSLVRRPGDVEVSAALGNTRATNSFSLNLLQPELTLDLPQTAVRRVGSAIDTPLPLLQPAVFPLTATIIWPDGIRRDLTEFAFLVNGRRQPIPATVMPADDGTIPLAWDISNVDVGTYELQVQARDGLGYDMSSVPQTVTITVDRPQPATPTPVPTAVPLPSITLPGDITLNDPIMILLPILSALVVLGGLGLWWAIRRARAKRAAEAAALEAEALANAAPPPADPRDTEHVPGLERLTANGSALATTILTERDTLIGRDPDYATLVVDDPTVSRLHARLRRTEAAEFWLYDEGSASGTFLNHTRLGLSPRPVQHGDHLQFGRAAFRFTLQLPMDPAAMVSEPPLLHPAEPDNTTQEGHIELPSSDDLSPSHDSAEVESNLSTDDHDKGEEPSWDNISDVEPE